MPTFTKHSIETVMDRLQSIRPPSATTCNYVVRADVGFTIDRTSWTLTRFRIAAYDWLYSNLNPGGPSFSNGCSPRSISPIASSLRR